MSTELMYADLDTLLTNVSTVNRHSFFQIKYFIIMKEPTHQARLWRCIKELEVRKDSLKAIKLEIEDTLDNRRIVEIEIERMMQKEIPNEPLDIEERAIQVRKRQRQLQAISDTINSLNKKLKEIKEETAVFLEAFKVLSKQEKIKPYDDLESQTKMWNEKITQEFDLRGLLGLPVDLELAKTTLVLENDVPIKQKFVNRLEGIRASINQQMNLPRLEE